MKADRVVPEEEAAEVDVLDLVVQGVEGGDLADVVAHQVEQAPGDVGIRKRSRSDGTCESRS